MNRFGFDVRLTPQARQLLRADEALVLDWYRMAICCAGAGEMSLYAMNEEKARGRKGLVRLKGEDPIYAARAIFPHLAGREVILDARRTFGVRRFTSNLPGDFGLRTIMGRLPEPDKAARQLLRGIDEPESQVKDPALLIPIKLPRIYFQILHIGGSLRASTSREGLEALDPDEEVVLYDSGPACPASRMACRFLKAQGYARVRRYGALNLEKLNSAHV